MKFKRLIYKSKCPFCKSPLINSIEINVLSCPNNCYHFHNVADPYIEFPMLSYDAVLVSKDALEFFGSGTNIYNSNDSLNINYQQLLNNSKNIQHLKQKLTNILILS